jgi:hypothetical protein
MRASKNVGAIAPPIVGTVSSSRRPVATPRKPWRSGTPSRSPAKKSRPRSA